VSTRHSAQIPIIQLRFHQPDDEQILCAYLDTETSLVSLISYTLPEGNVAWSIDVPRKVKATSDYRSFVFTSDEKYLVFFRDNLSLAIHLAANGSHIHNLKLTYAGHKSAMIQAFLSPMFKVAHQVAVIDNEKGSIINVRDRKFVRSIKNWNGRQTRDDRKGLYAPTRGGLELLDLKKGSRLRVFIPKVAEGVFDVETLITGNDLHVVYYHSGKRTIRVFRIADGKKIADFKSAAKVTTMVCTQDSRAIVVGCEDGTVNMLIIADPLDEKGIENLRAWRRDQLVLYSRESKWS